ncbi:YbaN family protein [Mesobacillus foraminis]|uniref:YbaN family protein n=1 Tax=Mesobacillus foraminis TaxID=279826 RepID=UPI00214CDDD7|nr:YbaN family protein [Mesobacillus foraminis]
MFLGLGIVGILLPVLPTTPLLLLASFFFVKGSERFEVWFKGTSIYKKHLEGFLKERAMTLKQKITLNLFADAMIAIAFFTVDILAVRLILLVIVIYKYYYFAAKIKTVKQTQRG